MPDPRIVDWQPTVPTSADIRRDQLVIATRDRCLARGITNLVEILAEVNADLARQQQAGPLTLGDFEAIQREHAIQAREKRWHSLRTQTETPDNEPVWETISPQPVDPALTARQRAENRAEAIAGGLDHWWRWAWRSWRSIRPELTAQEASRAVRQAQSVINSRLDAGGLDTRELQELERQVHELLDYQAPSSTSPETASLSAQRSELLGGLSRLGRPATARELAGMVGSSYDTVRKRLQRMAGEGLVRSAGDGWSVVDVYEPDVTDDELEAGLRGAI